jgi:peptidoglycan hydrolase-like protein with peptidoglycan-binding domain
LTVSADTADIRVEGLAMHGWVWRAGSAAIAISLCILPAGAVATGRIVQFAQDIPDAQPGPSPVAEAPAPLRANSPEQIRKAQAELRRLDCFQGRIDGKLGDQTRQAVKKFWASAKQPVAEVTITDELISSLAERGDNYCRPPRRFFGFGGHPGGGLGLPLPFAPSGRPTSVLAPAAQPSSQ